jgi:D-alanine transaminase|tara:strand:- start:20902 stop:21732 length:831 start_codon:yes stop_codon:yes gene_type:complete
VTKNIKAVYQGSFDYLDNIKVSPLSRAFLFSDSIYEVIPFQNKKFICAEEHFERLNFSASQLRININFQEIKNEIIHLFENSDCSDGYIYYQVSRGIDDMRSHIYSPDIHCETFGYLMPLELNSKSLKVAVCEDIRWGRCDIKSTSLLGNVLQMNAASDQDCDEIIMHKDNIITEGGASNIFFIQENKICTPKLSNKILPGITRAILIEAIKENDLPFEEGDYHIDLLKKASCIWFTSSTKGVAPVNEVINCNNQLDLNNKLMKQCQVLYQQKVTS